MRIYSIIFYFYTNFVFNLQRNINIASFVKDFNEKTAHIKEGIPIPCRIKVNPDRSYILTMHKPPATYYLKQAAGIQKGKMWGMYYYVLGTHQFKKHFMKSI